jgi:hypothetical protein
MSGPSNFLIDTNVIILGLKGNSEVRNTLEDKNLFISVITEIELNSIPFISKKDEALMADFISNCFVLELDYEIKRQTITIRKQTKTKLPDAIIAASAYVHKLPLLTADKGFTKIKGIDIFLF